MPHCQRVFETPGAPRIKIPAAAGSLPDTYNLLAVLLIHPLTERACRPEIFMKRFWLLFSQTVTVLLAAYFVVGTLKPDWLMNRPSRSGTLSILEAPAASAAVVPPGSFRLAAQKSSAAVVSINTSKAARNSPHNSDPWFKFFFGEQGNEPQVGLGSGVIVSASGYILTNNHVVESADEIEVILNDSRHALAKVIGTDPDSDLAVLKIDLDRLPVIVLGNSDSLQVGDQVLAIGNPFGVGQTVTGGIVSALGRNQLGINTFENFIQTDAAINPGNSGGALVDMEGRLIGINTWIASSSGGSQGIGFAVPVNMARRVMERLISGGRVQRGFLGITLQDVDANLAKQFGLSGPNGALVNDVMPHMPADKAGIQSGDVIVSFNGKPVADGHELQLAVSDCSPGSQATVKLIRNRASKTLEVTLGELPKQGVAGVAETNNGDSDAMKSDALEGVMVSDLDRNARQQLRIPEYIQGALVEEVGADSNAAAAGLQKGDVLVEINRLPVGDASSAVERCQQARGDQILLKIWRRNGERSGTRFLSVDNTKRESSAK